MPSTYTSVSWVSIVGVAVLVYYVYYYKPAHSQHASSAKLTTKFTEKRRESKKLKKVRKDDGHSNVAQEKSQKDHPKPKVEYTVVANDADRDDEEINNREFARQLSSAKSGALMPAKAQDGARQRSIKQSRAQEKPIVVETSSDNGTTGADADDDRSSLNSPKLDATSLVTNGDVTDMLEAQAPGPAVLRVTSPTTPASVVPKKAKPETTHEVAETKKQRQNRKKSEQKKLAREEDEKERKVLLEKQRRSAREAEGRPAKDGSAFMASKVPSTSAWTDPTAAEMNGNGNMASPAAKMDYLDTYTQKASAPQETTQSESELAGSDWQKVAENISEEEQVRRALEDSDSWKTVGGKEKRSKKKTQPALPTRPEPNDESSDYAPPHLISPTGAGQKWQMTLVSQRPDGEFVERETEVQDSEWEVA